ncbi:MAG: hypothetical protein WCR19_03130 [Acholeplasmataceae bacterium]
MNKKIMTIMWLLFSFVLFGCDSTDTNPTDTNPTDTNNEETYQYTYDITKYNYDEFITFSFQNLETTSEEHSFKAQFNAVHEDDYLSEVNVTLQLKVISTITGNSDIRYVTKEITVDGKNNPSIDVTYSIFDILYDVTIKDISGSIKTNLSHEKDMENSELIEKQLFDTITQNIGNETDYLLNTKVKVKQGNIESISTVESKYQASPFYFAEKFNDGSGFYISEQDNSYQMYEFGTYELVPYYRLISIFDNPDVVDDIQMPIEDNDAYYYTYKDGIYYICATYQELLSSLYDDQSFIDSVKDSFIDDEVTVSIELSGQKIIEKINMETISGYIEITMTFTFGDITPYNMSFKQLMPPNNPAYITQYTDLTEKQTNQLYVDATPNYYLTELKGGIYALELEHPYEITIYDLEGNIVDLEASDNDFLNEQHDNILYIDQGTYIVEIYGNISSIQLYDFQLVDITHTYDSIIDMDHPLELSEGTVNVDIEGAYDYVLYTFNAPNGGLLTLSTTSTDDFIILAKNETSEFRNYDIRQDNGKTNIFLTPGMNEILFSSYVPTEITFDVEHHGTAITDDMSLTDQYQDDYLVTYDYYTIYLSYEMTEQGYLVLNLISDNMLAYERTNYSGQIWTQNTYGNWEATYSFSIKDLEAKVYLQPGAYKIRILGSASLKIKGYFEDVDEQVYEEITPQVINDLNVYKQYLTPDDYNHFTQFPFNQKYIAFTLTEDAFVYIDVYYYTSYILLDALENVYQPYPYYNSIIYLEAGTYYVCFDIQSFNGLFDLYLNVCIIIDPFVINDDYPFILDQYQTITEGSISINKDFSNDFDIFAYTTENQITLTVEMSANLHLVIYDITGKLKINTSAYSYTLSLEPGTYLIAIHYGSQFSVKSTYTLTLTSDIT